MAWITVKSAYKHIFGGYGLWLVIALLIGCGMAM